MRLTIPKRATRIVLCLEGALPESRDALQFVEAPWHVDRVWSAADRAGRTVDVMVADEFGRPVAAAAVRARTWFEARSDGEVSWAADDRTRTRLRGGLHAVQLTDAQGRATFAGLEERHPMLALDVDGHERVRPAPEMPYVDLRAFDGAVELVVRAR